MTTKGRKEAAQELIAGSDREFLICRTLGHKFNEATSRVTRSAGRFRWSMDCSRCGASRTKILSLNGRIVGSTYNYPKGYKSHGIGRLDARGMAKIRIHVITRVI